MMHRSTVPATWLISALALVLAPAVCLIAFRSVVSQMAGVCPTIRRISNSPGNSQRLAPCCRISATTFW